MKSPFTRHLANSAVVFCVGMTLLGCTEEQPAASESETHTRTYTNRDFGFSLDYPAGWHFVSKEKYVDLSTASHRDLVEKGVVSGSAECRDLAVISKHPWPSSDPTPGVAAISFVAEKLPVPPATIPDGLAYLIVVRKQYDKTDWQMSFDGEPYKYPINGVEFYRLDHTRTAYDMSFRQSSLATVTKGHVLCIVLTGLSDPEMNELETIVSTLQFERPPVDERVPPVAQ